MILYISDIGKMHNNEYPDILVMDASEYHAYYYASTINWLILGKLSLSEKIM